VWRRYTAERVGRLDAADIGISGDVLDLVLRDLGDRGLGDVELLSWMVTVNPVWGEWASNFGRDLAFVTLI
jgi:hypothetical protein